MGNVQSEIISSIGANEATVKAAAAVTAATSCTNEAAAQSTNDYDPRGEVIPDVTPFELLRTVLKLEKFERCLSCVTLPVDPRSPTSQERDISIAKMAAGMNNDAMNKGVEGAAEKNDVDVMSTIEEGDDDDDDDSTSLNTDEKQQQQYHHGNNIDEWKPAKVNQHHDPNANLWHSEVPNSTSVGSEDVSEFNPDRIAEHEGYGSAEYTEFDPDAILAAEEQQQQQRQQQQKHVLTKELDNVLMMRSEENGDELFQDDTISQSEKSHVEEETSSQQQFIGLTDPMDVAQQACNATYQQNVEELLKDVQKLTAAANDYEHHVFQAEVGDANKIANQHFDDIISDFELSPSPRPYSNVRSLKNQRAQKQRRNKLKSSSHVDATPLTSNTAFFVEETTVGRKLNGISSPKATECETEEVETSPTPSYETEAISVPSTESAGMDQDEALSSYPDDELDTSEQHVVDESAGVSADMVKESYETDAELNEKSYETDADLNVHDEIIVSGSYYSADEMITESVDSSDNDQKIVSDLSGESQTASSAFEEGTNEKLKGLLKKASTESESVNDSVNWDNLAYSASDGSKKEDNEYSYDEIMGRRHSGDNEVIAMRQSSEEEAIGQSSLDAAHENEENLTPTFTTKDMEDKIKQMKKQHENELQTYLNESHNTPRHQRYLEVQRRIDAMREQHKTNIDNMRAVMKEANDDRNPSNSGRNKYVPSQSTSSRFNFDDNMISIKKESRDKAIRDLIKQNAELEEEMKHIRSLSPRSPDSLKLSPKPGAGNAFSSKTYSRQNILGYSPRFESPRSPESTRDEPEANEARETLSTMIYDANADEERMNTRVNGMIADIKSFLEENDKVQERLSKDIMSYGV